MLAFNLGLAAFQSGDYVAARAHFAESLRADPHHVGALNLIGASLMALKQYAEAEPYIRAAIATNPSSAAAYHNHGMALIALDRPQEAEAQFSRALALDPNNAETMYQRALAFHALHRPDAALQDLDRVLSINPSHSQALFTRGQALARLHRDVEAFASYGRALELDPAFKQAAIFKGYAAMMLGDYRAAWPLLESRTPRYTDGFKKPQWRGDFDISGLTVLAHFEQGLGDTIQFARYLPQLARRCRRLVFEVQSALAPLFVGSGLEVITEADPLPEFDAHCPLMSLPLAFGTTLETVPHTVPYIAPSPAAVADLARQLGPKSKPRVGLAWSGDPKNSHDLFRSMAFSELLLLLDLNVEFISLQTPVRESDRALLASSGIRQLSLPFLETAAVMKSIDLMVTVDTSLAHLAGAIGVPVWIMLAFDADPRWLREREDSPWYPTARLFRQSRSGDWAGVVERIRSVLPCV